MSVDDRGRKQTHQLGVDAITDKPPPVDSEAVDLAKAEKANAETEAVKAKFTLQDELTVQEINDRIQDRDERLRYAARVFWLIVFWLAVVGEIVLFQGSRLQGFHLSDPVMLAILGGTTASVISIFLIVANYLFPRAPRPKS